MFGDVHTKNVPVIVDIALTRFSYMSYLSLQTKKPALGWLNFYLKNILNNILLYNSNIPLYRHLCRLLSTFLLYNLSHDVTFNHWYNSVYILPNIFDILLLVMYYTQCTEKQSRFAHVIASGCWLTLLCVFLVSCWLQGFFYFLIKVTRALIRQLPNVLPSTTTIAATTALKYIQWIIDFLNDSGQSLSCFIISGKYFIT